MFNVWSRIGKLKLMEISLFVDCKQNIWKMENITKYAK